MSLTGPSIPASLRRGTGHPSAHRRQRDMPPPNSSHDVSDAILAGGLVLAPAWATWLTELNALLTTASLIVGLAFGLVRLWVTLRDRR